MPDLRARSQDLQLAGPPCRGQTHHEYATVIPLRDIINPTFFLSVQSNLRPGDLIALCRFDGQARNELVEVAEVRVVRKSRDAIDLVVTRPIMEVASAIVTEAGPAGEYAAEGWKVEWKGPTYKWAVVDKAGEIRAKGFDSKEAAEAVATGAAPLPVAA